MAAVPQAPRAATAITRSVRRRRFRTNTSISPLIAKDSSLRASLYSATVSDQGGLGGTTRSAAAKRMADHSWAQIAEALGVTRQAAQVRFGEADGTKPVRAPRRSRPER